MELVLGEYQLDEIQLVSKILEYKPPLDRRRLAQELGLSFSKLKKLLKRIKNDWKFSIQINYHVMGLRKIVLLLKGRPNEIDEKYLSLYASTIEGNFILSYYLPIIQSPEEIIKKYSDKLKYYLIFQGEYKPKPNLIEFFDKGVIKVDMYEKFTRIFSKLQGTRELDIETTIRRFNEVDLKILMELQKDPLRSMRAIAEALGYTVPRVSGHVKFLTKYNVIESFSIRSMPRLRKYLGRLIFATIVIGTVPTKYPLMRLAKTLSSIPLVGTVLYGNILVEKYRNSFSEYREKIIYIPILTFEKIVDHVHELVELIKEYIDVYDVVLAMRKQKFTLPYKHEEYSKYKGFWNV